MSDRFWEWVLENKDLISRLVFSNGGWEMRGWGCLSYSNGIQMGLEQDEALTLIDIHGTFQGACMATGRDYFDEFFPLYKEWTLINVPQANETIEELENND